MKIRSIIEEKDTIPGEENFEYPRLELTKGIVKDHLKDDTKYNKNIRNMESLESITESPDHIDELDINWDDDDGVTFALIDDYYIYDSSERKATHGELLLYLYATFNYDMLNDKQRAYFEENKSSYSHIHTNLPKDYGSSETFQQLLKLGVHNGRGAVVKHMSSQILQGRLWTDNKIISFWSDAKYILQFKNKIIDFVKMFGDPTKYSYEVDDEIIDYQSLISDKLNMPSHAAQADQNSIKFATYADFANKTTAGAHSSDELAYDPRELHTMSANQKKQLLMTMGAKPKLREPLMAYRSFGDSLEKVLKSLV